MTTPDEPRQLIPKAQLPYHLRAQISLWWLQSGVTAREAMRAIATDVFHIVVNTQDRSGRAEVTAQDVLDRKPFPGSDEPDEPPENS